MSIVIPHWLRAALIGAAPMLGIVFLILFVFTILGLVQRLKTIITRTCINFKKQRSHSLASNGNKGVTIRITDDKTNNIQTVINKDDDDSNHEEYQQQLLLNEQSNPINYDHLNSIPMIDIDRSLQKLQEINTNEDDKSSVIQLKIRSSKSDGKLNENRSSKPHHHSVGSVTDQHNGDDDEDDDESNLCGVTSDSLNDSIYDNYEQSSSIFDDNNYDQTKTALIKNNSKNKKQRKQQARNHDSIVRL
ncbi:unnamed protein product [Didymodactylos carnosus]|uniref:Uncharacterized protein n=1 Tax=Didymodactylos carnosus TaxID=1234261 RepID=A0A814C8A0_9BILA|nr:unnamed protein product [Didymodactylos carnosus]CAF3717239.1 unnamed protein product [Didymodactylos carnosus]